MGYGQTCAGHFGLPWGAKAANHQTAQAALVAELLGDAMPDEEDGADLGADYDGPDPADEAERRAVARAYNSPF